MTTVYESSLETEQLHAEIESLRDKLATTIGVLEHRDRQLVECKQSVNQLNNMMRDKGWGQGEIDLMGWYEEQLAYQLPDDLYPTSKDWRDSNYAGRVAWLHSMYESRNTEVEGQLEIIEQLSDKLAECQKEVEQYKQEWIDANIKLENLKNAA